MKLPRPPAAEYFIGTVDGEPVAHLCVSPFFHGNAYRATRLVVMPEWQGAGVGTKFLEEVCRLHACGQGRQGRRLPTLFHTSHPQLIGYLRRSGNWVQKSGVLFGASKLQSQRSIRKSARKAGVKEMAAGYGGHFRAVQGFKYTRRCESF